MNETRGALAYLKRGLLPPRVIIQGPCGVGKTIISSAIIAAALATGKKVGFLANRRLLVSQKCDKLRQCGIPHSVLMRGESYHWSDVTVCSKDTYWARAFESSRVQQLTPDIWIVDECHEATGASWTRILACAAVTVIGLSATPARGNGKGLGDFYSRIVVAATHEELLSGGYLCPPRVFAPYVPDLSGLTVQANGDWSEVQLEKRLDDKTLIGDVVKWWLKAGEGRPTVCFGQSVAHSIHLRDEFRQAGIAAEHIDADTETDERERDFAGILDGSIKVLCNYGVLTTGVDLPELSCEILAFATNSLNKYLQCTGRVLRTSPGKADAIVLDHGGNVHRHGWPTEDREWSLDPDQTVQERDEERREREKTPREPLCCPECGAMRESGPQCPNCGHRHTKTGLKVLTRDGVLKEITPKKLKSERHTEDQRIWNKCLGRAAHTNLTFRQASQLFKKLAFHWPPETLQFMPEPHKRTMKVADVFPQFGARKKSDAG